MSVSSPSYRLPPLVCLPSTASGVLTVYRLWCAYRLPSPVCLPSTVSGVLTVYRLRCTYRLPPPVCLLSTASGVLTVYPLRCAYRLPPLVCSPSTLSGGAQGSIICERCGDDMRGIVPYTLNVHVVTVYPLRWATGEHHLRDMWRRHARHRT
eukprot:5215107-Pyramimonas_sp.AAC.1